MTWSPNSTGFIEEENRFVEQRNMAIWHYNWTDNSRGNRNVLKLLNQQEAGTCFISTTIATVGISNPRKQTLEVNGVAPRTKLLLIISNCDLFENITQCFHRMFWCLPVSSVVFDGKCWLSISFRVRGDIRHISERQDMRRNIALVVFFVLRFD